MANVTVLNTDATVSGKTVVTAEGATTQTGLITFDRDPSAPFAVSASSAVVTNLDADKLDGKDSTAFLQLANAGWTVYSPTWGNTGTANTLGNGQVIGTYFALGKIIFCRIWLLFGTTSVAGSAVYTFTLPTAAAALVTTFDNVGVGILQDASVGAYGATVALFDTAKVILFNTNGVSGGVTGTSPFAMTNPDFITMDIVYQGA